MYVRTHPHRETWQLELRWSKQYINSTLIPLKFTTVCCCDGTRYEKKYHCSRPKPVRWAGSLWWWFIRTVLTEGQEQLGPSNTSKALRFSPSNPGCVFMLVFGQRGGRGRRGRGQENHSAQSEENKVSQGSRPRPQEFWDKWPILYMQPSQSSAEFSHHSIITQGEKFRTLRVQWEEKAALKDWEITQEVKQITLKKVSFFRFFHVISRANP